MATVIAKIPKITNYLKGRAGGECNMNFIKMWNFLVNFRKFLALLSALFDSIMLIRAWFERSLPSHK